MSTRLEYREPKRPRAVCVYTIAQESRYLIIENITTAASIKDMIEHCKKFGQVTNYRALDDHISSTNTEDVCLVEYDTINSARFAKRKMDDKVFYHHKLRVYYAPEYETFDDIRVKFADRFQAIHKRLNYKPKANIKPKKREIPFGPMEELYQKPTTVKPVEKKRRRI